MIDYTYLCIVRTYIYRVYVYNKTGDDMTSFNDEKICNKKIQKHLYGYAVD